MHRGRRLAFSIGILVLSVLSGLLLIVFGGITDALIPLFAVGAFLAFTLSQVGMLAHWLRQRVSHARGALAINVVGASATGLTLCVVLVSKFSEGAWFSVVLVAGMWLVFYGVRRHYDFVARTTATQATLDLEPLLPAIAVVPMRRWDAITLKALRFAVAMGGEVMAVQVLTEDRECDNLGASWPDLVERPAAKRGQNPPRLVVLKSRYRELYQPLLNFLSDLAKEHPEREIAVVMPQLVEARWFHALLHMHTASILRRLLLRKGGPQIVVVDVPWHMSEWRPERKRVLRPRAMASRQPRTM